MPVYKIEGHTADNEFVTGTEEAPHGLAAEVAFLKRQEAEYGRKVWCDLSYLISAD